MVARKLTAFKAFVIGMARSDDVDRALTRRVVLIHKHKPKWKSGFEADQDALRRDLKALGDDRSSAGRKLFTKFDAS